MPGWGFGEWGCSLFVLFVAGCGVGATLEGAHRHHSSSRPRAGIHRAAGREAGGLASRLRQGGARNKSGVTKKKIDSRKGAKTRRRRTGSRGGAEDAEGRVRDIAGGSGELRRP